MIRLRLFGISRHFGDPVSPVLQAPAQVGWQSWFREVDQVSMEDFSGRELILRARGTWSVEPEEVARVVLRYGELRVSTSGELLVELADQVAAQALAQALRRDFGRQVLLAP